MRKVSMNFIGRAGKYGELDVHDGLVCSKFASVASERIVDAAFGSKQAGAGDLSVDPLTIKSLNDGR